MNNELTQRAGRLFSQVNIELNRPVAMILPAGVRALIAELAAVTLALAIRCEDFESGREHVGGGD
jgi:hypothetical protein